MSVGRPCIREVDTADPNETAQIAGERMHSRNVGTLVVVDKGLPPIGIVTDRELATRVVAQAKDARDTTVGDVMTAMPKTVSEETPIEEVIAIMRSGPFRRLTVVDGDEKLVGLVSIDDLLDLLASEFNQIGELLKREGPKSLALS